MNDKRAPVFSNKKFSWRDGKRWFDGGINSFKLVKNYWYLTCLLLGVLISLLSSVSAHLVAVVVVFASPLITAFIMNACFKVANQQLLSFAVLWQDVLKNINALMVLGVISAVLSLLAYYTHNQLLQLFSLPLELTEEQVKNMTSSEAMLRAVLNIATNFPIAMALAFSPALIVFKQTQPFEAVKQSVIGVVKSWQAFVVLILLFMLVFFGIVILASLVVAMVMAVLGPSSQILVNVIVLFFALTAAGIGLCAQYHAYMEVFWQDLESNNDDTAIYAEI